MLKFNIDKNIYAEYKYLNLRGRMQPIVWQGAFIPFQFFAKFEGTIDKIELINDITTIDVTNLFNPQFKLYKGKFTNIGYYYVFMPIINVVVNYCGNFQFKITLGGEEESKIVYSSWFDLVNKEPEGYIIYSTTKQFIGNRLYSNTLYKEKIYFQNFNLQKIQPELIKNTTENGDGTDFYDYQRNTKRFKLTLLADEHFLDILENINLFETYTISTTYYSFVTTQKPELDIDYDDSKRLYNITLTLIGNYTEVINCNNTIELITVKQLVTPLIVAPNTNLLVAPDTIFKI